MHRRYLTYFQYRMEKTILQKSDFVELSK